MNSRASVYELEQLGYLDEAEELRMQTELREKDIAQVERERRAERKAQKRRKELAHKLSTTAASKTP